jgi:hypothetical protein
VDLHLFSECLGVIVIQRTLTVQLPKSAAKVIQIDNRSYSQQPGAKARIYIHFHSPRRKNPWRESAKLLAIFGKLSIVLTKTSSKELAFLDTNFKKTGLAPVFLCPQALS